MRERGAPRRRTAAGVALALVAAPSVVVTATVAEVATAPPAAATFATGGDGLYKGAIDWFDFDTAGRQIVEGETDTTTRTIGDQELVTTCTLSDLDGEIQTYRPGTWRGDGLDDLYNVGGPDNANTLVNGIANTNNAATVAFDFDCDVTLDGEPVPVGGLVFADAESSNLRQGEFVAATTDEDVTWRVIDRYRTCDTSVLAWLENDRLQLGPDADQCSDVQPVDELGEGPMAVGFMEGATGARVELKGGGTSAVAVGVMLQTDFGDAPESYGSAGALNQPSWQGGEITPNTQGSQTNVSDDSFTLGTPQEPVLRLGDLIDSEGDYQPSDDALADDETSEADEDGIDPPGTIDTTWGETHTQDVRCSGGGFVSGWIDWNANGTFDDGERSDVVPCADGTATLTWTVPDDAVDSLGDDATFLRLRTASSQTEAGSPTGLAADGEVEDYTVEVDVPNPGLTLTKTADPAGPVAPGTDVTYTVTVENTGEVDYTAEEPATFTDDLSDVIDDATYNEDAAADVGEVTYDEPVLSWEGPLAVGDTATITYTVTANDPVSGDGTMTNTVVGPEESNCADGSDDADCTAVVPIRDLVIEKTADPSGEVSPGDTVTYTVTVTNPGGGDYTADDPATFTDDLSGVLDDATYNADAAANAGEVTYAEPQLSWSGALAAGETATITYSVTVLDPAATDADGTLTNAVVGPPESNCAEGSDDPDCSTDVPVRALHLEKTSDGAAGAQPGDTVTYTITVENTGSVPYTADDPATFDDDLTEVLDDATYHDDASADIGTTSYEEPTLSWSGPLEPGETATITYSVTVNDPVSGDGELFNVVVGPDESNCTDPESTDPDCVEPDPVKALQIAKTSDADGPVLPGDTVTYTVEVTNTGGATYTATDPATFTDDLSEVVDDATWNDDATASSGTVSYAEPELSWSGALEPGETATITYSVTVNDPLTGDGTLTNAVVGPDESNCDEGADPANPDCGTVTPVRALQITKTAEPDGNVAPGDTVAYTVTVENTGGADYTAEDLATFDDDLTEVLDDAVYNGDEAADVGEVSYEEPTLSWQGPLAAGQTATITYSVTVNDPVSGDGTLTNAVVGPDESNCDEGTEDGCGTVTPVRALEIAKTADPSGEVLPGDTVTYTVTVENTGGADYTTDDPATFTDDLSEVLDDATYNDDASPSAGAVSYAEPELSWSGALAAGDTATITYSVTVNDPVSGDGTLTNAVVGPEESTCPPGSDDPDCSTEVPVRALHLEKTSDGAAGARPGDTVTYTITATNTGQVAYTEDDPATFDDDLTEVLDDAAWNDDATASSGDVSFAEPTLSWSGALEPGETATITYSVTVNDPATGDGELFNVVVGPEESNCTDPDSQDPDCVEPDPVKDLEILKTADPEGPVDVGDTVTYTVEVTNTGSADYTAEDPASFTDDLTNVLDDAAYNDDAAADTGAVSYAEPELSWSGPLPVGETATVTYSVTVNDPLSGDGTLANAVLGPQESNCPVVMPTGGGMAASGVSTAIPEMPDGCQVITPVRAFEVSKTVDVTEADPGDVVTYTVTVTSTGAAPYTDDEPAGFTDDLSEVLDDATPEGEPTASAGELGFTAPILQWRGPLDVDGTVTVTYALRIDDPDEGDGVLTNVVTPDGSGGTCAGDGECTTTTTVTPPGPSPTPSPTPSPQPPGPGPDAGGSTPPGYLPQTGAGWVGTLLALGALLTLAGGLLYRFRPGREG
ncbi:CshA/CshB family fibrillar adhesin-related protein [Isoptericola sp. F-RaC21]|uniref:CshA/CshB family fibrillar adhesin-related protein n=1 Tax=Isoptericola sp. F-RaC21 TaxID=3141452 RepID=UPI00315B5716